MNIRTTNLSALNCLTKYPSILTYHELGERGILQDSLIRPFPANTTLYGTEKVDGTNVRIILGFQYTTVRPKLFAILGSREELLWESNDLIGNPSMGIVNYFRDKFQSESDWIDSLRAVAWPSRTKWGFKWSREPLDNFIMVLYGELYGHKIGSAAKQYTTTGKLNFRLFDVMVMDDFIQTMTDLGTLDKMSIWRENAGKVQNGPNFLPYDKVQMIAQEIGVGRHPGSPVMDTVPPLFEMNSNDLPTDLVGTSAFLSQYRDTLVSLDGNSGNSEGVVIRTADRGYISKLRFEDYNRKKK